MVKSVLLRIVPPTALGVLAACSSLTPASDPVNLRLTDMEARLIRIERVINNQSLIDLATQVSSLQAETQSLRGEIETLRFEAEQSSTRQRDLYVDIDSRLQALEQRPTAASAPAAGAAAAGAAAAATGTTAGAGMTDQQAYDAAFALVQGRRYDEAASAFQSFLATRPTSVLRDNAQYWLGETFYVRRQFNEALVEFQRVLDDYPQSGKLPDALLKVGYCNHELKRYDAARQALQQVARLYPDTSAARLAQQRLERIAQETG